MVQNGLDVFTSNIAYVAVALISWLIAGLSYIL
jgi:hypothetical protein